MRSPCDPSHLQQQRAQLAGQECGKQWQQQCRTLDKERRQGPQHQRAGPWECQQLPRLKRGLGRSSNNERFTWPGLRVPGRSQKRARTHCGAPIHQGGNESEEDPGVLAQSSGQGGRVTRSSMGVSQPQTSGLDLSSLCASNPAFSQWWDSVLSQGHRWLPNLAESQPF